MRQPCAMGFIDAAKKAAVDTRAHGLKVEQEALAQLKDKGVTVIDCDREAFRKRVLPQTDAFVKARPDAKPVVDLIRATSADNGGRHHRPGPTQTAAPGGGSQRIVAGHRRRLRRSSGCRPRRS